MAKSKGADWAPQPVEDDAETRGRVVANYGPNLEVEDAGGMVRRCLAPRKFADLVVGDEVEWSLEPDGTAVVTAVRPRRQALIRPDARGRERTVAANIDQVLVVFAPRPVHSVELIDRYLVAAEDAGLRAALVLNKVDLLDAAERQALETELAVYRRLGYPLVQTSAHRPDGLDALLPLLRDHTSILVGQSGTGKSSLIDRLVPEAVRVGALSEASGHGRHTTSVARLYRLPGDGALIDSPGVRAFGLGHLDPDAVAAGFVEFRPYLGRCRFRDCRHGDEPGCALRAAVEAGALDARRFQHYRRIVAEEADPMAAARGRKR